MGRSKKSSAAPPGIKSAADKTELRYQELVESLDAIVWRGDARTFQFTFVSQRAETILGYPSKRWITEPDFWRDHIHPEDRDWAISFCQKATQEKKPHEFEYRMIAADGRVVWLRDSVRVLLENGEPSELTGVMIDITHRKLADHKFRDLLEAAPDALVVVNKEGKIVFINTQTETLFGYRREELMGQKIDVLVPESLRTSHATLRTSFFAEPRAMPMGINLGLCGLRRNGTEFPVEISLSLLETEEGTLLSSAIRDVTERKRAEQALHESEERWRAVFENSAVGIALTDLQGKYLSANRAYQEMVGYAEKELRALSFLDILPEEDREISRVLSSELREGKRRQFQLEKRYRRKDGNLIWVRANVSVASDTDGKFRFGMAVVEDVTERKRAEHGLRESEARFRVLADSAPVMVWMSGTDMLCNFFNKQWLQFTGRTMEQESGNGWSEGVHREDLQLCLETYVSSFGSRRPFNIEYRLRRADGEYRWILDSGAPRHTPEGEFAGYVGSAIDITERKRAEDALLHSEERLRLVIDTVPALIHTALPDGQLYFFNQGWLNYVGLSLEDLSGWKWTATIHPEDVAAIVENWRASIATGQPFEHEARVRRADGEFRWMIHRKVPLCDKLGNIVRWYGSSIDIEDRKRAEMQWRALIDAIPQQIWSGPPDGTNDFVNQRWRSDMGLELEDLRGDGWQTMLHPDDRDRVVKAWNESVLNGTPYEQEERHRRADGTFRWYLNRGVPLRDAEGRIIRWYGTNTDIEDRKRAEEALRASEQRWRAVFENSAVGIALTEPLGKFLRSNRAYQEMTGYTDEELRALSSVDITYEEDRVVDRALSNELWEGKRQQYQVEKRYRRKDGSLIWVRATVSAATGTEGKPRFGMGIVEDITERKRAEEELRRNEAYLAAGQSLSHTGSWAWNFSSRELFWSQETFRIFGFDPSKTKASINETFLPRIHPQDRSIIEEGLKAASIQKESYGVDYRIVLPDGSIRHIHDVVYPVSGEDGVVTEQYGVIVDETERKLAEQSLRESEQKFRTLFEESRDPIVLSSRDGRFLEFNQAALALCGYSREEMLRLKVERIYANPDDRIRFQREIEEKGTLMDYEVKLRKKDGTVLDCLVAASAKREKGGGIDSYQSVFRDITERKQAERTLRALTGRLLRLQDEERRRIARELHDTTAQDLAALTTGLDLLGNSMPDSDQWKRNLVSDNAALAKKCARDIRTLSYLLHPPRLDEGGLPAALPELAEGFSKRSKIRVDIDLSPEFDRLPQEIETTLFRVVQESLNNIHRHSGSLTAKIRLFRSANEITLEVKDAGRGLPPGSLNDIGRSTVRLGVGILGMHERLRQLGGSLEIISDGRGTCVKANLPLHEGDL